MSTNQQHQGDTMKGMSARAFGSQSFHNFDRQPIEVIRDERDVVEPNPPTMRDVAAECITAAQVEVACERVLSTAEKTLALLDAIGEGGYVSVGLFSENHSELAFRTWASVRGFTLLESRNEAGALIRLHLETYRWSVTMYVNVIGGAS